MQNADRILEALTKLNSKVICDDCLEEISDVHPRQQVYRICSRLAREGSIFRQRGTCSVRTHAEKIVNRISGECLVPPQSSGVSGPSRERQTFLLSEFLREMNALLTKIDDVSKIGFEPFAARVARLRHSGVVSNKLSALLNTVNSYRVQVVKEGVPLNSGEWSLCENAMSLIRSDRIFIR